MKKIVKLTESDLTRIVKRVINESVQKQIRDPKITKQIKDKLEVPDMSSGYFKIKYGANGGITVTDAKRTKSADIIISNMLGIPDKGTWSINHDLLILTLK
jgi:hypothetical protein